LAFDINSTASSTSAGTARGFGPGRWRSTLRRWYQLDGRISSTASTFVSLAPTCSASPSSTMARVSSWLLAPQQTHHRFGALLDTQL
jgi:hypothetical protein